MRAVVVNEYGGTPAVAEVPTPQPGAGQVLIKLRAAGMNPMDRTLASGDWRPMPATFPMVLGADGAGVVESVGEGATRYSAGESVFGQLLIAPLGSAGTYAEYVAATEDAPLAQVPDGLDLVVASALPTAGMAGLSLVELLGPLTGKTVLIVGAGGGVGTFATQFAVNAGARVIANVRDADADRMHSYGAAETVDHTAVNLADAVRKAHPDGIEFSWTWSAIRTDSPISRHWSVRVARQSRPATSPTPRPLSQLASPGSTSRCKPQAGSLTASLMPSSPGASRPPRSLGYRSTSAPAVLSGANDRPIEGKTVITL